MAGYPCGRCLDRSGYIHLKLLGHVWMSTRHVCVDTICLCQHLSLTLDFRSNVKTGPWAAQMDAWRRAAPAGVSCPASRVACSVSLRTAR
eukprot:3156804-Prymnesium_polylepis.1